MDENTKVILARVIADLAELIEANHTNRAKMNDLKIYVDIALRKASEGPTVPRLANSQTFNRHPEMP